MKTMSKLIVLILVVFSFQNIRAQLNVSSNGSVSINANIQDWWSGLRVTVPTANSCAYHLTYAGQDRFYVCAQGWLWAQKGGYFGSDLKLKQNINKINSPLSTVLKLNGIQFDYKDDESNTKIKTNTNNGHRLGFIAQEVEEILPGLVQVMPDSTKAVAYTDMIALLVEAIKEQQIEIESLKTEIKKGNGNLKSAQTSTDEIKTTDGYLLQNTPNPFSNQTEIGYFIEKANSASIMIFDLQGTLIKTIPIQNFGQGTITLSNSDFKAGMYLYTLVSNGLEIDTKRMIVNN